MSHFTPTPPDLAPLSRATREAIDHYFVSKGQGFNAYQMRLARMRELCRLDAMSACELAAIGLTRGRIPEFVFEEIFAS